VNAPAPESGQAGTGRREFFVGPFIKTDLLCSWLEQHGIAATSEFVDPALPDEGDLDRDTRVWVSTADYPRAQQLFFTEREDEL